MYLQKSWQPLDAGSMAIIDVVVAGSKAPLTSGSYLAARNFVRAVSGHRLGLMLGWLSGTPADDDDDDAPAASTHFCSH